MPESGIEKNERPKDATHGRDEDDRAHTCDPAEGNDPRTEQRLYVFVPPDSPLLIEDVVDEIVRLTSSPKPADEHKLTSEGACNYYQEACKSPQLAAIMKDKTAWSDRWAWLDLWTALRKKWPQMLPDLLDEALREAIADNLIHTKPQKLHLNGAPLSFGEWCSMDYPLRPKVSFHAVTKTLPPLSPMQATAFEIIKELPEHRGIHGPQLTKALADRGFRVEQSTLTSRIIPALRLRGVLSSRSAGYHIAPDKRFP